MKDFANYSGWSNAATTSQATDAFLFNRGGQVFSRTYSDLFSAAGLGNVSSGETASVNNELALFSGTGGKTIKRASASGIPKLTSGVLSTATAGADYIAPDTRGNVGIGTTPAVWNTAYKVLQLGQGATLAGVSGFNYSRLYSNLYVNASAQTVYQNTGSAGFYSIEGNTHTWLTAPSGSAGAVASMTTAMTLDSSSNLTIQGSTATKASGTAWSNPSDRRLKENIRDYGKGLTELLQVRVREWEYNGKGQTTEGMSGLGVVADEIMVVLPNTVTEYVAKLSPEDEEPVPIKKVDASEITWLLVKAVQELSAKVAELEAR